jgi:methionine-rich copper-binding protein CopC
MLTPLFHIVFFAFILFSNQVAAHAVVMGHSLKIAPIQPHQKTQVTLSFNSKIEVGLSQAFLVKVGDEHESLKVFKGDRQGQMIVGIPPLEPGNYAIRLKVLAADGHLTEDIIRFVVADSER